MLAISYDFLKGKYFHKLRGGANYFFAQSEFQSFQSSGLVLIMPGLRNPRGMPKLLFKIQTFSISIFKTQRRSHKFGLVYAFPAFSIFYYSQLLFHGVPVVNTLLDCCITDDKHVASCRFFATVTFVSTSCLRCYK